MNRKLDIMTVAGILLGLGLLGGAMLLQGNLLIFVSGSAAIIVLGGSFSALLVKFTVDQIKTVAKVTKNAFFTRADDMAELIENFVNLGQKARREGLLSLEDDLEAMDDRFFRNGLQMVVDGLEPELIKDIMETEIFSLENRHKLGQDVFKTWGSMAPAFGMIGTLIGLIQMLVDLEDPSSIGIGMAIALLTTFYGALVANLIFIPIAGKLQIRSEAELLNKEAILEGVLSIQAGTNPRVLQEKLKAYVSPQERAAMEAGTGKSDDGEEVVLDA